VAKLPPNSTQKGHHFVTLKVMIPRKLTEQQKQIIEQFAKVEDPIPEQNY